MGGCVSKKNILSSSETIIRASNDKQVNIQTNQVRQALLLTLEPPNFAGKVQGHGGA